MSDVCPIRTSIVHKKTAPCSTNKRRILPKVHTKTGVAMESSTNYSTGSAAAMAIIVPALAALTAAGMLAAFAVATVTMPVTSLAAVASVVAMATAVAVPTAAGVMLAIGVAWTMPAAAAVIITASAILTMAPVAAVPHTYSRQ